jgi:hypothetical protein
MGRCRVCSKHASLTCSVCRSSCCEAHTQRVKMFGSFSTASVQYCTTCYSDLTELHGTKKCSLCEYLTNNECTVCKKPCCTTHSLLEHQPTKQNIEAQTLNKTRICDECASKKYVQRKAIGGGGALLLIVIILIIVFSTPKH